MENYWEKIDGKDLEFENDSKGGPWEDTRELKEVGILRKGNEVLPTVFQCQVSKPRLESWNVWCFTIKTRRDTSKQRRK